MRGRGWWWRGERGGGGGGADWKGICHNEARGGRGHQVCKFLTVLVKRGRAWWWRAQRGWAWEVSLGADFADEWLRGEEGLRWGWEGIERDASWLTPQGSAKEGPMWTNSFPAPVR